MLDCKHNVLHKPILLKMEKERLTAVSWIYFPRIRRRLTWADVLLVTVIFEWENDEEDKDMIVNEISLVIQNIISFLHLQYNSPRLKRELY